MGLFVAALLVSVLVPHDVIGKANDLITSSLGHFCESFRLSLVLKRVTGKVDAYDHVS